VRRRSEAITGIRPGRRRRRSRRELTLSRFCQGLIHAERVRATCGYVSVPDVLGGCVRAAEAASSAHTTKKDHEQDEHRRLRRSGRSWRRRRGGGSKRRRGHSKSKAVNEVDAERDRMMPA
jgi:hypothetical protein